MPKLAEQLHCTGCTACASVCPKGCIAMVADHEGFRYPQVDPALCVQCGACERACPVLHTLVPDHTPQAYAVISRDEEMRRASSSGGVFTEIAKTVLQRGGVVFGAVYNEQFDVIHICAEREADLAGLRGAKYAQSDLRDTFTQVKSRLAAGQPVLFSGTPCQVAGLHAFLGNAPAHLFTVDFICHAIPSPAVWRAYVAHRAAQDNDGHLPCAIDLRCKDSGWSHYRYSNRFTYPDGHSHQAISGESLYMKLFVGDHINRRSCGSCSFKGAARVSDVTLGDFWGIWDIAPEMDDDKGTSLVLVQSEKGQELFDSLSPRLIARPVTLKDAGVQNPSLIRTSPASPLRGQVVPLALTGDFSACARLIAPPSPTPIQRLKRRLAGVFSR